MNVRNFSKAAQHHLSNTLRFDHPGTRSLLASAAASVLVVGCWGYESQPTNVTTTTATLNTLVSCDASTTNNPCTGWYQYWQDGASSTIQTGHFTDNAVLSGALFAQPISGLTPGALYHSQFCGYGDNNVGQPGMCASLLAPGTLDALNPPGQIPDPGDLSAAENFRTAIGTSVAAFDLGRVLSTADVYSDTDHRITRDAGYSVQYSTQPAMSLWMFGDTVQKNGPVFIAGTTAAAGPFVADGAPYTLNELPTPPLPPTSGLASPAPFFPISKSLKTPSNQNCNAPGTNSYSASWPGGGAQEPSSSKLVLTFSQVCVVTGAKWPVGDFALTEYDPATNQFSANNTTNIYTPFVASNLAVGIPPTEQFSSPIFGGDGYLYLFAFSTAANAVYVARVAATPSSWGNKGNYQWWGKPSGKPAQWGAESLAISLVSAPQTLSISVGDYSGTTSHKYVMLIGTVFNSAAFSVYEASSPTGPWTLHSSTKAADVCTPATNGFGCRAVIGHPELSTAQQLVYSWYSSDDADGFGHVRIGAINW